MSLIYKKEDQIIKSANELQELIQGESYPKISFEEILYDFIDTNPGVNISRIQTEFSKYGNSLWIMDVLEGEKKICFLNGTYSRFGFDNNPVNGWYTWNYLELVEIKKQLDENKLENWQIKEEEKLYDYLHNFDRKSEIQFFSEMYSVSYSKDDD